MKKQQELIEIILAINKIHFTTYWIYVIRGSFLVLNILNFNSCHPEEIFYKSQHSV